MAWKRHGITRHIFLLVCICMLTACQKNYTGTKFEFLFNTSEAANAYDEKTIYIEKGQEKIKLNASLDLECGEAVIQIVSADNTVIWENSYSQSGDFSIELNDLEIDSEYVIRIQTTDTKKVSLVITSEMDLAKDKEKPDKKIR